MGLANLGIAMGAGVDQWNKQDELDSNRAYKEAATKRLNAETAVKQRELQSQADLSDAVDSAVSGMYGPNPGAGSLPGPAQGVSSQLPAMQEVSTDTASSAQGSSLPAQTQPATASPLAAPMTSAPITTAPMTAAAQPAPIQVPTGASQGDDFASWRKTAGPKITASFIKAGKPEAAKSFIDFMRSEEGQGHASSWLKGMKAYEAGDFDGAIPHFAGLYNNNRPDGRNMAWRSTGDGGYQVDHIDSQTGGVLSTRNVAAKDLATFGLNSMAPAAQVKWNLDKVGETEKYQRDLSKLDRQEEGRFKREQEREDRRDDRADKRLEAQERMANKRIESSGGLTLAQQRGNEEIENARQTVSGLKPDEIKKRTQKFTATGRENPDYDASLERQSALASRRKIGDDAHFDTRQQGAQPVQSAPQQPSAQQRFSSDPSMKGHRVGKQTANGLEVLDASGKLLGHYR